MSYTIGARGGSGRYMPETTENERFWASLHAKNRKRPPKWPPKITENDPPWHISSKGIFGGPGVTDWGCTAVGSGSQTVDQEGRRAKLDHQGVLQRVSQYAEESSTTGGGSV